MIHVTKIGDLTFELRFDEKLRQDLIDISGWGTVEGGIERILCDILLGSQGDPNLQEIYGFDCDEEMPL